MPLHCKVLLQPIAQELHCSITVTLGHAWWLYDRVESCMPRHCKVLLQPVAQQLHCSIPVASVDMAYGKVGNCTKLQCTLYLQAIAKSSSSPLHRNCIAASLFDGTLGPGLRGNVGTYMKLQCTLCFQPMAQELHCSLTL